MRKTLLLCGLALAFATGSMAADKKTGAAAAEPAKPQFKKLADIDVPLGNKGANVPVGYGISMVRMTCTQGQVNIGAVWTMQNGSKVKKMVMRPLKAGEYAEVVTNSRYPMVYLLISHSGQGAYKVEVK